MPIILLTFVALWTAIVMRVLGSRAVLSLRTFGTYLLVGGIFGPLVFQTFQKLINADGWNPQYQNIIGAIFSPALLILPVLTCLLFRRAYLTVSVADAFLLGFSVGLGSELVSAAFAAGVAGAPLNIISYFPPWTVDIGSFSAAGYAYWVALPALVLASTLRFSYKRSTVVTLTLLALLMCGLDRAVWSAPEMGFFSAFRKVTLHGGLIPWGTLFALVALSIYEARWVVRATGTKRSQILEEWQALLSALADHNLREFGRLEPFFGLRRQAEIAQAELSHSPEDEELRRTVGHLRQQVRLYEGMQPGREPLFESIRRRWPRRFRWQAGIGAAVAVLVLLLPRLPDAVGRFFWSFPILHWVIATEEVTLLGLALIMLLLWWYLVAAPAPSSTREADEVLRFRGEQWILQVSLAMALLALIYRRVEDFFYIRSSVVSLANVPYPQFTGWQLTTMMLLLAAGASTVTLRRSETWQQAVRFDVWRSAVLRNILTVVGIFILAWAGLVFFQKSQLMLQNSLGAQLSHLFGRGANLVRDTFCAIGAAAFIFGLFRFLLSLSKRAQTFLFRESMSAT